MARLFDAVIEGPARRTVRLQCTVRGTFPGTKLKALEAPLQIEIKDSMCWTRETFHGVAVDYAATSDAACRNLCRTMKTCSHYLFTDGQCKQYQRQTTGGSTVTAHAKIPECTDMGTCLRLKHARWALSGEYCPIGYDVSQSSYVYLKNSSVPEEAMYLSLSMGSDCVGDWMVQSSSLRDHIEQDVGYFDLQGAVEACVPDSSISMATLPCKRPSLPSVAEMEGVELQHFVFDDPGTLQPDDHWLHPCDCLDPDWGTSAPAEPMTYEAIPPGSNGSFVPPPVAIVSGQFACPARQLLPGGAGIKFLTEPESREPSVCQERCQGHDQCNFFFMGTSHGASVCRLFHACDSLVREFGMEGELFAFPRTLSCAVSNPESCWKTTLRREFLIQQVGTSPASHPAPESLVLGGTADWSGNATATLSRSLRYALPLGNSTATVEAVGWTSTFKGIGLVRDVPGFASVTISGLSHDKAYRWSLQQKTNQRKVTNSLSVNGGMFQPLVTTNPADDWTSSGVAATNPRGELQFVLEANRSARFETEDVEHTEERGGPEPAARCPSGSYLTSCNCYASDRGRCTGAEMLQDDQGWLCQVRGDLRESNSKLTARARCMTLQYATRVEVKTSSQASFSFLNFPGARAAEPAGPFVDLVDTDFIARRRRSRRRRRTLPAEVSATCPAGERLLACSCVPDGILDKGTYHYCIGIHQDGNSCRAQGGYAQALCMAISPPAVREDDFLSVSSGAVAVSASTSRYAEATCPSDYGLLGCWCSGSLGNQCQRTWIQDEKCYAHNGDGTDSDAEGTITLTARCHKLPAAQLFLSKLQVEIQSPGGTATTSLLSSKVVEGPVASTAIRSPTSFRYIHLHQQCDTLLLLGGVGVETCLRPSYRDPESHPWKKRPLPVTFDHGSQLSVSCWKESYVGFRQAQRTAREKLSCVNGNWYNSNQLPGLQGFSCEACVQVTKSGYGSFAKKGLQELYFFNRMALRVFTELGSIDHSAAPKTFCLDSTNGTIQLTSSASGCPESVTAAVAGSADPEDRLFHLLHGGVPTGYCLQVAQPASEEMPGTLSNHSCVPDEPDQLISPMAIPYLMWSMHQLADRSASSDFHGAHFSYCGKHGALSSLAFGQIFGGETNSVSNCQFAPVILFGSFVASGITYGSDSLWPNWNTMLADSPVTCEDGAALTGFKLQHASKAFMYECSRIAGLGASFEYFTAQVEVTAFAPERPQWIQAMRMIKVDCGKNGLLSGFHFEFSEGGRWARSKYTCSKAGGAPVVVEPSRTIRKLYDSQEGTYCPVDKRAGRLRYENYETGDMLDMQEDGAWCVGGQCSTPVGGGAAVPADLMVAHLEVHNLTDFDGQFQAKGVPDMTSKGSWAARPPERTRTHKPPTWPKPPGAPKLQDFDAKQPTYATECLDYQDLWKKLSETVENDVTEDSPLVADPATGQRLVDYHPCAVAAGATGIFGELGGGSGKEAPPNMLYGDWNECFEGSEGRESGVEALEFSQEIADLVRLPLETGLQSLCAFQPDIAIAPLGLGTQIEPDVMCEQILAISFMVPDFAFGMANMGMALKYEEEDEQACNPFQVGLSRLFCDIHCVRDAVIRGDRTIIRNLEKATKISNDNMKKLVEWSVEAGHADMKYLDAKIDYSAEVTRQLLQPKNLLEVAHQSESALRELSGYATAIVDKVPKLTANKALKQFLANAESLNSTAPEAREAQAERFHSQLQLLRTQLHASASGSHAERAERIWKQMGHEVSRLQGQVRRQLRLLGNYHHRSAGLRAPEKPESTARALGSLDRFWWQIRKSFDRYLDAASEELDRHQGSLAALEGYQSCKLGSEELLRAFAHSMRSMTRAHRQLHSSWREMSNTFGELAAIVQDGNIFETFACDGDLDRQTLEQSRRAVQSLAFLLSRFKAAGLRRPSLSTLRHSISQVSHAYKGARASCRASSSPWPVLEQVRSWFKSALNM
ncbi:ACBP2 [Symbiodinium natans]|uniref:ACBP2 protein n=1 Tax=Symbiodinium natans TaxID=878477 RepID=A0A812URI9_9DINO|nr:ACBP2 [Symbiodinium natans]